VLAIHGRIKAASQSRPKETAGRIGKLLEFFGEKISEINGELCRAYVARRSTDAAVRRELEDLRAAINHHRCEGLCSQVVAIVLPEERPPRERWLTRREAGVASGRVALQGSAKGSENGAAEPAARGEVYSGGPLHWHTGGGDLRCRPTADGRSRMD
jgi:hypothetical protein